LPWVRDGKHHWTGEAKLLTVERASTGEMDVAVITVGDELLAGDTANTNGTWLARQLTERGVAVRRIVVVPDARATIADRVRADSEAFDAVVVTGGIGGTPDDVTMEAVADAFDRDLVVSDLALADVEARLADLDGTVPDLSVDAESEASVPAGSRPLLNDEGLAPGCVLENVYVLPGIPGEMKAMFRGVAGEFEGAVVSRRLYTVEPEANIVPALREAREQFGVRVGCYPDREAGHNRLKLSDTDAGAIEEAAAWLLDRIDASETPVERDWDPEDASSSGGR
jgi:molybdenum cofactor synthesis domain-containing protein